MDVVTNSDISALPEKCTMIPHYGNYYHHVLHCLGYPNEKPPVADLLRTYHGLNGKWFIVSPVFWQATHNDAMIMAAGSSLHLTEQDSRLWFTALSDFVQEDNISLIYHDAHTWLMQVPKHSLLNAKPVHQLLHQSLTPHLKQLDPELYWQRLLTEIQMLFSAHSLNQSRGALPINGVWVWGDGLLNLLSNKILLCDDPETHRLAMLLSKNVHYLKEKPRFPNDSLYLNAQHSLESLQTKLQNHNNRWYWNNMAYCNASKPWWKRTWR